MMTCHTLIYAHTHTESVFLSLSKLIVDIPLCMCCFKLQTALREIHQTATTANHEGKPQSGRGWGVTVECIFSFKPLPCMFYVACNVTTSHVLTTTD